MNSTKKKHNNANNNMKLHMFIENSHNKVYNYFIFNGRFLITFDISARNVSLFCIKCLYC